MFKNALVLGAGGMAGSMICRYLSDVGCDVISLYRKDFDPTKMEIPDFTSFDYVINCIGIIKQRNANKDLMFFINGDFPHKLATKCKRLIHISSDCVFSGQKSPNETYLTNDKKDAKDDYGKSKAFGECSNRAMVLRTSIIGPANNDANGLFEWFLKTKESVNGFNNHYWSGITTLELAKLLTHIMENDTFEIGIKQIASNCISKLHLLQQINEIFELNKIITSYYDIQTINRSLKSDVIVSPIEIQLKELKQYCTNE